MCDEMSNGSKESLPYQPFSLNKNNMGSKFIHLSKNDKDIEEKVVKITTVLI